MELFGGILAVKAVVFLTFSIFAIAAVGYSIGRIEVKGIDLELPEYLSLLWSMGVCYTESCRIT